MSPAHISGKSERPAAAHLPVMLDEVIDLLDPRAGACVVDATVGAGGHAEAIAERLGPSGLLLGLDRDPSMLELARPRLERFGSAVQLTHARFSYLREVVLGSGRKHVDAVVFDLGVASPHLDRAERGFSFKRPGPLDMRLDATSGATAAAFIARADAAELADLLRRGGCPSPTAVARALKSASPLETTEQVLGALRGVSLPRRRHHPATLVFQALRIAVNDEYAELEGGLASALDLLAPGGRLAVISYHSGEDRRVKRFLADEARGCICPPDMPVCGCGREVRIKLLARGRGPLPSEVARNPRARSAHLRGGERC